MKEYYQEQLAKEKKELEYVTIGVVTSADKLISDCVDNAAKVSLSLEDICILTDSLNAMLGVIHAKQESVERTEKLLSEYSAKSEEVGDDDNHE